jgi:putative N-acetylmannosamine-6-phosphate epimerase
MPQLEINSKKIETLTKVARLLGDQIQAQGKIISNLQSEIEWIKETLKKSTFEDTTLRERKPAGSKESKLIKTEKTPEEVVIADTSQINSQKTPKEKKSEKEELLQALTIIDNL